MPPLLILKRSVQGLKALILKSSENPGAKLAADKAAMVSRHQLEEKLEKASMSNAVVRFGKAAGRKTEYMLFLCKEYALNTPGCATGRSGLERAASGLETVKAKTVDGAGMAKAQAMKVLQPDKVKK